MKDATLVLKVAKLWMRLDTYRLNDCKLAVLERARRLRSAHSNRFFCATERETYCSFATDEEITLPSSVMLIVCPQELALCNISGDELDVIKLALILSWGYDDTQMAFVVCKGTKEQNLVLSTQQGPFIDFLLKGYARLLAKKEVRTLANLKEEGERVPYAVRSNPRDIKKQRAGYQLVYDVV